LTQPEEVFFTQSKKIEYLIFFWENFSTPNHRWLTQPDLSYKKLT